MGEKPVQMELYSKYQSDQQWENLFINLPTAEKELKTMIFKEKKCLLINEAFSFLWHPKSMVINNNPARLFLGVDWGRGLEVTGCWLSNAHSHFGGLL
jgi:hypothetical protein